ncbi:MAG TPA: hypothetical protein VI199_06400 [Novosphingobium sp.]
MRYILQLSFRARPGQEAACAAWYRETHLQAVLGVPGVVSGRLSRQADEGADAGDFNAAYRVEAGSLQGLMQALSGHIDSLQQCESVVPHSTRLELFEPDGSSMAVRSSAEAPCLQEVIPDGASRRADVIERAIRIAASPEVQRARQLAEMRFKWVLCDDPPAEAWPSFATMMDEYVFNNALKAANGDPGYPCVMLNYAMPHVWNGLNMPGSRVNGDNCDNTYRLIPMDGRGRFRVSGRRIGRGPSDVTFTLVGNWEMTKTLGGLEGRQLVYEPDGCFEITIDPDPADGRPNHIQSRQGAVMLFVRDSMGDWDEHPNELTVLRLDPPEAPPLTDRQMAERAAELIVDSVPQVYWYMKYVHATPNKFPQLIKSDTAGGLSSQMGNAGSAIIADDEAMLLTITPCGAEYFSIICQDYWWITMAYDRITSSRNTAQTHVDDDGTATYVICASDPGVHNWIDTAGLHNVVLNVRLQGLAPKLERDPLVTSRIVKLSALAAALPAGTRMVTPIERAAEIADRTRQVAARYAGL